MAKIKNDLLIAYEAILSQAVYTYISHGLHVVLWHLPGSSRTQILATQNPVWQQEITLENSLSGFVFAPFLSSQSKLFFPSDELLNFQNGVLISYHGKHAVEILSKSHHRANHLNTFPYDYVATTSVASSLQQNDFIELIKKCRQEIRNGSFEKIVPTRSYALSMDKPLDFVDGFDALCTLYPKAMVYAIASPLTGIWMGATPELLTSISADQHFRTMAMAATQPHRADVSLETVSWTQKEIEEQALVERYIINCFKKIRLREFQEHGPRSIISGNVVHLKTDFDVDMTLVKFPKLGSVMLKLLHPTSAVCGMPVETCLPFLKKHEKYDRQYYCGYLGPVNFDSESHLYVNIRCLQIFKKNILLYAGAGITADSIPEKEWIETKLKMTAMLRIIRHNHSNITLSK